MSPHSNRDFLGSPRHQFRRLPPQRRARMVAAGILKVQAGSGFDISIPGLRAPAIGDQPNLSIPGIAPPLAETPLPLPGASILSVETPKIPGARRPKKDKVSAEAHPRDPAPDMDDDGDEGHAETPNLGNEAIGGTIAGANPVDDTSGVGSETTAGNGLTGGPDLATITVDLGNEKSISVPSVVAGAISDKVRNVGKRVTWTAFGKDYTGNIFCVMPAGMTPNDLEIGSGKSKAKARDEISYVIAVDGGGEAWPATKDLKIVK